MLRASKLTAGAFALAALLTAQTLTAATGSAPRSPLKSLSAPVPFRAPAVPYAEDHFRDMAGMRYDKSPYYMPLQPGDTTVLLPEAWTGRRVMLHRGNATGDTGADTELFAVGAKVHATGLTEGSYLYSHAGKVSIRSLTGSTKVDTTDYRTGRIDMEILLEGLDGKRTGPVAVEYQLFDPQRHQIAAGRADGAPRVTFGTLLPDIQAWNHEYPYSYMLAVILRDDRTGEHIESVGVPVAFVNESVRGQRTMVNSRPVNLFSYRLDTVPAGREAMNALLLHLRDLDYNAVAVPDPEATTPLWRHLCRAHGLLLLKQAGPRRTGGPWIGAGDTDADIIEANRRIVVNTGDETPDSTLVLTVDNRYDFTSTTGYGMAWQLLGPDGRTLGSAADTLPAIEPHASGTLTLAGARYPLRPGTAEAFLDYTVTTPDGELVYADQKVLRGTPAPLTTGKAKNTRRKLKVKKNVLTAKDLTLTFDPASGAVTSIRTPKGEMLNAPLSLTLGSEPVHTHLERLSYHGASRTATAALTLQGADGTPAGRALLDFAVANNGVLTVACRYSPEGRYSYMRPALWMRLPASALNRYTYLGRRSDPNAAERATPRIANYRAGTARPGAATETRYLSLEPYGVTVTSTEPFGFELVPMKMHGEPDITSVGLTLKPGYANPDNFLFRLAF